MQINAVNAQKVIAQIIYELGTLSPPKFVWFQILTFAGLRFHFSDKLVKNVCETVISIEACKAGNLKLFMLNKNDDLDDTYCKIAYKRGHHNIMAVFDEDHCLESKINAICRYAKNINPFSDLIISRMQRSVYRELGKNGNLEIIRYVNEKCFPLDYEEIIIGACLKGHFELIKVLLVELKKDLDLHEDEDLDNDTVERFLKYASQKKNWEIYDYIMRGIY